MTKETKHREPLIGYMVIDDYADDYSDWNGQIAFPNPRGANLYWENPIKMVEYAALAEAQADVNRLTAELVTQGKEIAELKESRERLVQREYEALEKYHKTDAELNSAKAEIERLQQEVVNRNQYKINQEYLDNVHSHYEKQVAELRGALGVAQPYVDKYSNGFKGAADASLVEKALAKLTPDQKECE